MFFKFQNFSNYNNFNIGSPFSMAARPLLTLGIILIVLGLLITKFPEVFAGLIAFILYFLAAVCIYISIKLWRTGRRFNTPPRADNNADSVKVDVKIIE
ncbi:MAG: hypothetical protein JW745_08075 [Sedimentisphaerales bacterium]|nr:hypothetical protein [Sedimentisphaerales bacterium]MBN2843994.1 hypothetical protein [Sedimentisphaerales bacterium]